MKDTPLAPTQSQTAAAVVYSRSSPGHQDNQNHSDQAVPILEKQSEIENRWIIAELKLSQNQKT